MTHNYSLTDKDLATGDAIGDSLDLILVILSVTFIALKVTSLSASSSLTDWKVLSTDLGQIWDILEKIGIGTLLLRAAYWIAKKIKGEEKYHRAIWQVLDDAHRSLSKREIRERTKRIVGNPITINPVQLIANRFTNKKQNHRNNLFDKRFRSAWYDLNQLGYIKRHQRDGEDAEPLYSLNQKILQSPKTDGE